MANGNIGYRVQPGVGDVAGGNEGTPPSLSPANIKVLNLRIPKREAAGSMAPRALLQSPGSAGAPALNIIEALTHLLAPPPTPAPPVPQVPPMPETPAPQMAPPPQAPPTPSAPQVPPLPQPTAPPALPTINRPPPNQLPRHTLDDQPSPELNPPPPPQEPAAPAPMPLPVITPSPFPQPSGTPSVTGDVRPPSVPVQSPTPNIIPGDQGVPTPHEPEIGDSWESMFGTPDPATALPVSPFPSYKADLFGDNGPRPLFDEQSLPHWLDFGMFR